jgi:glucans biosynthesis protein
LRKLPPDVKIEGIASADANGEVVELIGHRNDAAGGWRLALRVKRRDQGKPVELRAYLRGNNNTVSETWSYILPPE